MHQTTADPRLTLRLPVAELEQLERLARDSERSVSGEARLALRAHIKRSRAGNATDRDGES